MSDINCIKHLRNNKGLSISEIQRTMGINWRTAKKYADEDQLPKQLKEDAKQIRVIANVIDRNTQMMLEFWNHYFIANEFKMFATTETYRAEELNIAEQLVKKRIAHNRQRKLDREKRNKDV